MFKEQDKASRPRGAFSFGGDTLIEVYDRNLKPLGILENARAGVNPRVNELWTATVTMPDDDPKNAYCNHFNFLSITGKSGRYYGLYRIMPKQTTKQNGIITYECEHVLSTLMDDVQEGHHVFGDKTLKQTLEGILAQQTVRHWEVGTVEFDGRHNFSFEDERSLLGPIFEVP